MTYKLCSVLDCGGKYHASNFCCKHYDKHRKYGDPLAGKTAGVRHGLSGTKEYKAWENMHTRCNNPKHERFVDYGNRGIKVCSEWADFRVFISDMGMAPTPKHTVERLDNNQGYSSNNCTWALPRQQSLNKRIRKDNSFGIQGVCFYMGLYIAYIDGNHILRTVDFFDACCARKSAEQRLWN